jgi:hypothetical protein
MPTAPAQAWARETVSPRWWSIAAPILLAIFTVGAVALAAAAFGLRLPASAAAILAGGAAATALWPERAIPLSIASGAALLLRLHPVFAVYQLGLIGALYLTRRRTWALALTLVFGALLVPKSLLALFYSRPVLHEWVEATSLAATIFITVYWWRESRTGRLPDPTSPLRWALLYLLPFDAVYPIVFSPGDLWRSRRVDVPLVLQGVVLCLAKAAALLSLRRIFPHGGYGDWTGDALGRLTVAQLWGVVGLNYLELVLTLSGVAEVGITMARLYGWPLPSPFRFALLAWNPVELWRRWGIYTRRFLLKTVYFPLGGNERHRLRNVMLTFLASALLLHSGWLGSQYWRVGVAGWRDHGIYFLLQGLAVCGCLVTWRLLGKDPGSDRALRWSWGRLPTTLATQALSAWLHLVILAQGLPLGARVRLMARCLGLPLH